MVVAEIKADAVRTLSERVLESKQEERKVSVKMKLEQILNERRGQILSIPYRDVLNCITTDSQKTTTISRVQLPKDVYLGQVIHNPRADSFEFFIVSEKFDQVPPGAMYPYAKDVSITELAVKQR